MSAVAAISPVAFSSFGDMLRFLRRRARLQQRDLAIAVGYSESQICRLEQNQRLPDLTALAALFVPALNLEDQPDLAAKLIDLAMAARGGKGDARLDSAPAAPMPLPAASPAHTVPPSNLPTPLTPLVDRTAEMAAAIGLIQRGDVRLLTLVGPPGIGKTRLCVGVAAELIARFGAHVVFVALASVRDAALVLPTIAHELGVKERADRPLIDSLRAALRGRQIVLALDNFEQVLAAAEPLAELLAGAPDLKAVVTSRAALHLSGEHLLVVPPLGLPDMRALPPIEDLARYPAIRLFLARVEAINPTFALSPENAGTIAAICAGLDGLPLAIELAAARSRLFTPQALLDRLRSASGPTALQFLIGGPRDLLAHQRTLRGTLDWSYELLDEGERRLLMHVSMFVGDGAPEAIAIVCGDLSLESIRPSAGRPPGAGSPVDAGVMDGLLSLVDKSLLRYEADADGRLYFGMLETVREYGREKLEAAGLAEPARRRYVGYYLALASAAEHELNGAQQERWFRRLEREYDNLHAVLEELAQRSPADGLRLATSLRQFWPTRGYLNEGRRWLASLLQDEQAVGIAADVRARAQCVAGYLAYQQGDLLQAKLLSQASLALSRPLGDRRCIVDALLNLGGVAYYQNEYTHAAEIFTECLALYRELDAAADTALVLKNLGLVAKDQGDYARANAFFEESMVIRRELGDKRGVAQALFSLGLVAYWQGEYTRAAALAEQCAVSYRELGDQMGVAYALDTLGMSAYKQADLRRADDNIAQSLRMLRELGDQVGVAMALTDLGAVAQAQGDRAAATRLHAEALQIAWQMGDKRRLAFCLEGLAFACQPAQALDAAKLLGIAEALREAIGSPLPLSELAEYTSNIAVVRASCAELAAFERAWRTGRETRLEPAIGFAIDRRPLSTDTSAVVGRRSSVVETTAIFPPLC